MTASRLSAGVWIAEGAEVDPDAVLRGPLFVGDYAKVEAGAELREYTVWAATWWSSPARSCTGGAATTTCSAGRPPTCAAASSARTPT